MAEKLEKKPNWLYELQNSQSTSIKPASANVSIEFNLQENIKGHASPRYGRRAYHGAKSVETSPIKKLNVQKNKASEPRSSSARSSLSFGSYLKDWDLSSERRKTENSELQENFKKISLGEQYQYFPKRSNENSQSKRINDDSLIHSWQSLQFFNSKHKGRLGLTKKPDLTKDDQNFQYSVKKKYQNFNFEKNLNLSLHYNEQDNSSTNSNLKFEYANENLGSFMNNVMGDEEDFIIPELPQGKILIFNILTTWGDRHYLGLNGIEIFNSKGEKIKIKSVSKFV